MGKRKGNKNSSVYLSDQAAERTEEAAVNRSYKDTVFRMLFQDKKSLLDLYNAVSGKTYTDPEKLEIVTLENAVYMGMKNDLAFLVDLNLYLFEHQPTINKNMPLRFLQYVAAEYSRLTAPYNLYGGKLIKIPTPHFVVFYNGTNAYPEQKEMKLSDAFETQESSPELELRVRVLNINEGFNRSLKKECRILGEYMQYVDQVRMYAKDMEVEKAVDKAIEECIRQGVLKEFLLKSRAEVKRMSIFEYDEEDTRRAIREYAFESGWEEGREKGNRAGNRAGNNAGNRAGNNAGNRAGNNAGNKTRNNEGDRTGQAGRYFGTA